MTGPFIRPAVSCVDTIATGRRRNRRRMRSSRGGTSMATNQFTEKAQEALQNAQRLATRFGNPQVDLEHLLLALLDQDGGLTPVILEKAGIPAEPLKLRVQREIERLPKVSGAGEPRVSGRLNTLLSTQVETEASHFKDELVSVEHLLLALTEDTGAAGRILKEFGVTRDKLMKALQEVRGSQRVTTPNPEATYQALERYGRDLTKLASDGKLDPVI